MSGWRGKALGWFLEFRLILVLLWAYTSVGLGTAIAFTDQGSFDPGWLAVAMGIAGLVQGWVTHAINDIFDWRSGTDGNAAPRALSGGSKVLNLGLLDARDLWIIFAVATIGVGALVVAVALLRAVWVAFIAVLGYLIGLVYTLPPVATAYRPFVGEWLGAFLGVLFAGLLGYAIQTFRLSWVAVAACTAHALLCCAMLVLHHYLDLPADQGAVPSKRTTVVALGPTRAQSYAVTMALGGAVIYGALAVVAHPGFVLGAALTIPVVLFHRFLDPQDLRSVTRNEIRIIQLGIAAGLLSATALAPPLWPLLPLAALGYLVHLNALAPPQDLARVWRPPRAGKPESSHDR